MTSVDSREHGEELRRAWESALRILTYRERSRKELKDRLLGKKYSPEAVSATIEKLERLELLDDEKFARLWVNSRINFKPRSAWLIERELREKGIEPETARAILEELLPPDREREAARQLAEGRIRHYRGQTPEAARRKLFAYLARRGFSPGLVREIVNDFVPDDDPDCDGEEPE